MATSGPWQEQTATSELEAGMVRENSYLTEAPSCSPVKLRAAEYVRMSTEHQQYSTQNQAQTIREYAERRGIEIVKTYSDDARSGLIIEGRAALQQLVADVESGAAEYRRTRVRRHTLGAVSGY